jgi:hypothetical protein
MSRTFGNLFQRRQAVEQQRGNFKLSQTTADSVPHGIFRSWQRSAHAVAQTPQHAIEINNDYPKQSVRN